VLPSNVRSQSKTWTDAQGNPIQCIQRYSRTVVGFSHPNRNGVDRINLVQKLKVGSKLVLVPDPDNPVDRNAILVYEGEDLENDVGYLHSSAAKYIARMMECGATFSAEVYYIRHGFKKYPEVCIFIYHLTPATQKRRPVRNGAPLYKPKRLSVQRGHSVGSQPILESFALYPENTGLWTRIKRLLLLE
jgi:hypothetical protein